MVILVDFLWEKKNMAVLTSWGKHAYLSKILKQDQLNPLQAYGCKAVLVHYNLNRHGIFLNSVVMLWYLLYTEALLPLYWPMMSEAGVGCMAVETEPSCQYSVTLCCHVINGSRGKVWQSDVQHGSANEAKVWNWIPPQGKSWSSDQIFWEDLEVLLDTVELAAVKQNAYV